MNEPRHLALGTCALGRAIDADGLPLDGGPILRGRMVALRLRAPRPDERVPIAMPFWTGVRVIDGLLTIGRGARVGIFGAPGAGKSRLLDTIVEGCAADAVVVALVGERGREANDWIGRRNDRTTIVCATSDRGAHDRLRAAHVAFMQAVALRERGLHVLLLLDSLARVASALREIAVATGESAGRGGFPPSVFAHMAQLVEVAGAVADGSITLIATVIHEGDERDPVSEAARALLDGHIALALRFAEAGRFPAVDVPASASRTMDGVVQPKHRAAALIVRRALATLERLDDARALGIEPVTGEAAAAVAGEKRIEAFVRQDQRATASRAMLEELDAIAGLLAANR